MPNWCLNEIAFYCANEHKDELIKLHNSLSRLLKTGSAIQNIFGNGWLGNVAYQHGINYEDDYCRGELSSVTTINDDTNSFIIYTSTAWSPKSELWEEVCERYEGIAFCYCSEEGGNGIYVNTDHEGEFFAKRFIIVSCCSNHDKPLGTGACTSRSRGRFIPPRTISLYKWR